jgi:DNA-binding transcriptional LysR family regulator
MDVRQMNALLAVADKGSFSAAAKSLYTVQSNISAHISRLEREVGAVLIDRARGGLTAEGALVAARARRVQAELDAVAADLAAHRGEIAGTLRCGSIGTTARWLMPQLLPVFGERHPAVSVQIMEATTLGLVDLIREGRLELAILNLPLDDDDLQVVELFDEDLFVVVNRSHPLAELTSIGITDLADQDLLLPPLGTALRTDLDEAAARAGVKLRGIAEIDGGRLLTSLAMEGFGVAVTPATSVPGWLKGDFRRIPMVGLNRRRVGVVNRRRSTLSAAARAFSETLYDILDTRGRRQPGVHVL